MNLFKVIVWATVVLFLAQPAAAQTNKSEELRAIVEEQIENEFDAGMIDFSKEAASHLPSLNKDAHDLEMAKDEVKSLFYNKAYSLYICAKSAVQPLKPIGGAAERTQTCYRDRNKEMSKNFKLITEYEALLLSKPAKASVCLLKSRLFDAEIEFPPFDFLKQSTGRDALYNYAIMDACFLSINQ